MGPRLALPAASRRSLGRDDSNCTSFQVRLRAPE